MYLTFDFLTTFHYIVLHCYTSTKLTYGYNESFMVLGNLDGLSSTIRFTAEKKCRS